MSETARSRKQSRSRSASRSRSRSRSKSPKSRKEKKKKKKEKEKKAKKREKDEDGSPVRDKRNGADEAENMSIEEANRLRAELGIEPLAPAEDDEAEVEAARAEARKKVNAERAVEEKEKEDRRKKLIEKSEAKLAGVESLGKQLATETGGSAKDWVSRSRTQSRREEADKRAATLAEQEENAAPTYDSEDLAGLKVDHTSSQFQEGKMYTMTLKDSYLLTKDSGAENMDEDTLENVDLVTDEKMEKNRKLRAKIGVKYDANDEEANRVLLPQYEDEKEKDTSRLTGDEDERSVKMMEIREKLRKTVVKVEDDGKAQTYDLTTPQTVISDYLPAKPAKFKKRRKVEKGERHERTSLKGETKDEEKKERRKDKEKDKELTFEESNDVAKHQEDHASRSGTSVKERNEQLQSERRKQLKDASYLKAIQKAEKDSKRLLERIENVFEDEHDEELQSSLDRSRRLAVTKAKDKVKQENEGAHVKPEDESANREKKFSEALKSIAVKQEHDDDEMRDFEEIKKEKDSLVFTATTEFCRGLSSVATMAAPVQPEEPKAPKKEEKKEDVTKREDSAIARVAKEEKGRSLEDEDMSDEDEGANSKVKNEVKDFMGEEPMANRGAAAALALAKLRGLLKEEVSQAGRSQDEAYHYSDPAPNISLVYLDEFGRPMKPKEAFRQLSHVFHGRPPGPVKQEKKLKQFREEQRRGRILYGSRKSTLDNFVKKQKKKGEAFVVLDGSKKGAYDVGAGVHVGNPKRKRVEDDLMVQGGI